MPYPYHPDPLTPPRRLLGHVAQLLAALAAISVILSWGGVMAFNITHGRAAWGVSLGVLALYPALACLTGSFGVMLIRRPSVIRVSLALVTGAFTWIAALASCTTYDAVRATTARFEASLHEMADEGRNGRLPPVEAEMTVEALRRQGPYAIRPPLSWVTLACAALDPRTPDGLFRGISHPGTQPLPHDVEAKENGPV